MPRNSKRIEPLRNPKKSTGKTIGRIIGYSFAACLVFLIIFAATVVGNTPKINTHNIYSYLPESSTIYDDNNKLIDNIYIGNGNRINIKYSQMPHNLVNAVVSIEDKTFWSHHGFNVTRIFGAILESLRSGGRISGTSTITQQLARNVYLSKTKSVRSLNRKVAEAWYTILLEKNLSKKQIMEAYLNTIYLGYDSYGIQAASQAYFSKDAKKLSLAECAALASIPRSPDSYALVRTVSNSTKESDAIRLKKKSVLSENGGYIYIYNGDVSKNRRDYTLSLMKKYGYITGDSYTNAKNENIKDDIKIKNANSNSYTSYFRGFLIDQLTNDFVKEGYSKETAKRMIYKGGLKIYTSLNTAVQKKIESVFKSNYGFPSVQYGNSYMSSSGNILTSSGNVMLYSYSNYFGYDKSFTLRKGEYSFNDDGNMILYRGKRLQFSTSSGTNKTITIHFLPMYTNSGGIFYTISGGTILIPEKYKSTDDEGDVIISKKFFKDYPDFFTKNGSSYKISANGYSLKQKVRQPQASMVICDYKTGEIKAMVGGRKVTGELLYNRAISPRQPGSAIKPLSVYSAALQQGADAAKEGTPMQWVEYDSNQNSSGYGNYWTASSVLNDAPLVINGKIWPKNAYNGYRGYMTMRRAVEQSVNVIAVRVFQQVGPTYSASQLEKFGITSLVTNGSANDMNAAALALGGMTKGISPLEMASAYGTFPNGGVHVSYSAYNKVTDRNGHTILENQPTKHRVISKGVAYVMSDILRTTVTQGIASNAAINGVTVSGKTGTTSENYDAWFCGFIHNYSAALWIGNDVNLELSEGSPAAASLWSRIMSTLASNNSGSLPAAPSDVVMQGGEYYVNGTQP